MAQLIKPELIDMAALSLPFPEAHQETGKKPFSGPHEVLKQF